MGLTFFERLDTNVPKRSPIEGVDLEQMIISIKRNISRVLNTREGSTKSAPLLGLKDFNDASLGNDDLSIKIKRSIRNCLAAYEPRLNNMQIQLIQNPNSPLMLGFRIFAEVDLGDHYSPIELDLMLDSNKKCKVD
jgi:type VI secretion system protein